MGKLLHSARATAAVLAALVSAPVVAQQTVMDEPEPLREYRVELLVFEYLDSKGAEEDWSADPLRELAAANETEQDNLEPDVDPLEEPPSAEDATVIEFRYRPVEADLKFDDYVDRMRRSRDFRALIHTAWEQPGYGRDVASALDLARVTRLPDRLSGSITLWLGRFLHLDVALDLAQLPGAGETTAFDPGPTVSYKMRESRLLRSRRLHFLDHPKFGMLVRIDPVELPPAIDAVAPPTG
ncbi:MAG: CsiV family protein [Pseudomonadota bacterium]